MVIFDIFFDSSSVLNITVSNQTQCYLVLQELIKAAHGMMGKGQLLSDFLLTWCEFVWLHCKRIHQLLLSYVSDKLAAQWAVILNHIAVTMVTRHRVSPNQPGAIWGITTVDKLQLKHELWLLQLTDF